MSDPVYVDATALHATLELQGTTFADADITQAIASASRWIDEACGRRFYADTGDPVTRWFLPTNGGYAVIDDLYSFTSLSEMVDGGSSDWVQDQDFFFEPSNAPADGRPWTAIRTIARPFIFPISQLQQGWAGFDGRIQITGLWGWPSIPDPIVQATTILAGRLLNRSRTPTGIVALGMDGVGVRLPSLDPDVQALIGPYVRSFIA